MDPITMTYYASVCAALGYGAGRINRAALRIATGVIVGLIAAALLPGLRAALGI